MFLAFLCPRLLLRSIQTSGQARPILLSQTQPNHPMGWREHKINWLMDLEIRQRTLVAGARISRNFRLDWSWAVRAVAPSPTWSHRIQASRTSVAPDLAGSSVSNAKPSNPKAAIFAGPVTVIQQNRPSPENLSGLQIFELSPSLWLIKV